MAPSPRPEPELSPEEASIQQRPLAGDEVVITGMSSKSPECPNLETFATKLYNKEDMVTGDTRRWDLDHPEIPNRTGKVDHYNRFDAQFFGVHYKQAWTMEPMSRMLLEQAYGAIFDAGVNPRTLKNTKTGVFIGSSFSECEKTWFYERVQSNGFGITGCCRSMYANRISYWLGTTGPSYCVDSACSSSLLALEHAYKAIRSGQCDAAIVGGVNLCLQPQVSLQYSRLGYLSMDGKTKTFDKNADGYARSETIGVIYLQRAKDAKRVYAEVAHIKTKTEGYQSVRPPFRTADTLQRFLDEFYSDITILPKQVEFVEAYGAGLAESDGEELRAYDRVFSKGRDTPVLVGSVKSNMGHSEPASGINTIIKLCLAYHKGVIAPNLHYSERRDDVAGVREGRIRVVTEPTPFPGGYTAASSYSFSGVNVHVLLKGYASTKKKHRYLSSDDLPRLLITSGRNESAVKGIFKDAESRPVDVEYVRLLHNIFESEILGHVFRGYNLITTKDGETVSLAQNVDYFPGLKRPVWFVYSGMGSQWSGMGAQLMRIPIFAAAIERCCRALAPKGVDLMRILTDPDPRMYDNILHSFVGIAAVQIGLTDLLTALGIQPDKIIGHSVGELGCAYADGCFTAEEMILSAYSRGLVSVQTSFIRGSMAAVGRGYQEMKSLCPPEIEIACHNGPDSCTISGPADIMKSFVAQLTADGVFAKEVPCSNIAYHSKYIAQAGSNLLKYLREVIKDPKPRTARWLSTSVPQPNWNEPEAQLSSAEYHTNNLLSPVLFEETSRQIPPNAITIEVAPHGLLQTILRRSLAADCVNVPLTKRDHSDNVQFFLTAIGKLYEAGLNPKVANIYPEVQFPVSVDTPMLSHLVEWEHSEDWYVLYLEPGIFVNSGERELALSTCDQEYKFLTGNVINGVNVYPASGYLVLVWETLGMMLGRHYTALSVVFENVKFYGDVFLDKSKIFEFNIMIQKATGNFEIKSEGNKLASGTITAQKSSQLLHNELEQSTLSPEDETLILEEDIYKIFALKGHTYSGAFRSIDSTDVSFTRAELKWNNNWVTFLDSLIQLEALRSDWGEVVKPREILRLTVNAKKHGKMLNKLPQNSRPLLACTANVNNNTRRSTGSTSSKPMRHFKCGGVEFIEIKWYRCPKLLNQSSLIQKYEFVPNENRKVIGMKEAVRAQVQLALQNTTKYFFDVLEIVDVDNEDALEQLVSEVLEDTPYAKNFHQVKVVRARTPSIDAHFADASEVKNADLVIVSNISCRKNALDQFYDSIGKSGLLLSREKNIPDENMFGNKWHVVGVSACGAESLVLLKKRAAAGCKKSTKYITVKSNRKFPWVELVQAEWRACDSLVLVSESDPCTGLLGLFNCLRQEPGGAVLSLLLISDYSAPPFRPDLPLYKDQLSKNLALNVYQNGEWGSYQHSPLPPLSVQSEHVYLASQRPEDIFSLAWLAGPLTLDAQQADLSKKIVQVYYSAVSEKDVEKATTGSLRLEIYQLNNSNSYGNDFCGRTNTGERVMGWLPTGALSSLVEADVGMMWPIPPHWSMEDAATVPMAYANAFYCLELMGDYMAAMVVKPESSVLIHNGTEALGQALICVALGVGLAVYTTVDSQQKKEWLLNAFPGLKESNVASSNDESFEDMVKIGTQGKLCGQVISTLTGIQLHHTSVRCVGDGGSMLNLNLDDMKENVVLGMYALNDNRNYKSIIVNNIFKQENLAIKKRIQHMIAAGIAKGYVQPLSRVVFGASEASRAFRFTSTGRHVGKVLLKLRDEELRPLVTPERALLPAQPHFLCSSNGNYVVIVGPKDSGLELADWLVQRGAKNLLLQSQELAPSGYQTFRIRSWLRQGVNVQLSSKSLQTEAGCLRLLTDAAKRGPVHGLFFAPRASHQEKFDNTEPDHFAKDFSEKAVVVMNLDSATRKLCPHLKEFVVFTSTVTGRGAAGCSSGSLADSVMERICEERGKLSLPALALQWRVNIDEKNQNTIVESEFTDIVLSVMDVLLNIKSPVAFVAKGVTLVQSQTVFETLKEIIGANLKDVPDELRLEDLIMTKSSANEFRAVLEREYKIFSTIEKIFATTLREWKNMNKQSKETKQTTGLDVFFSHIDSEEFNAAEELVGMATAVSSGTEDETVFNKKDKYLILVPSMEGHRYIFPVLAQRLKIKASSCQLGLDNIAETIPQTAARLSEVILRKMETGASFTLLGYGFGVPVALEMTQILESNGHVGQVFCLDGSPRWFSALLDAQLGHLSEQRLQDEVIKHMFRLMSASGGGDSSDGSDGGDVEEALQRSLAAESDWERKLDACMVHLRGRVKFSFQYQRSLVAMAHARIRQARAYSDAHLLARPLRSELVLLKATRRPPSLSPAAAEELGRDYGLGAYSQRPLTVYELDCDHAAAPFHLNVSNILNEHVADLEEFKKLNLCIPYSPATAVQLL